MVSRPRVSVLVSRKAVEFPIGKLAEMLSHVGKPVSWPSVNAQTLPVTLFRFYRLKPYRHDGNSRHLCFKRRSTAGFTVGSSRCMR